MKKLTTIIFFCTVSLFAQTPDFSKEVQEAMKNFSPFSGKWEGKSWSLMQNGEKHTSNVSENMQWKLDNSIIEIEGVGKTDEGKVVHHALALLYYDVTQKKYKMQSHLASGLTTEATFAVVEPNHKYEWWFEDGRGGTIKYKISIENNTWKEEGEYSREGMQPMKFFEMNLMKSE
jgi:hypothetical protein